jgi:uncharacterized protein
MSDRPIESDVPLYRAHLDQIPDERKGGELTLSGEILASKLWGEEFSGSEVFFSAGLFRQGTDVLVRAEIRYKVNIECVRCLAIFPVSGELTERSLFIHRKKGGPTYPENEQYENDGWIDLFPWIRELILVSLPEYPLCREDCLGLCEVCRKSLNDGGCICPS